MTTATMMMQGHDNNDNNNKAPQTGRTTNANTVMPYLRSNNQPLQPERGGRRGDNMTTDDG
jgi:hypothetical protein